MGLLRMVMWFGAGRFLARRTGGGAMGGVGGLLASRAGAYGPILLALFSAFAARRRR